MRRALVLPALLLVALACEAPPAAKPAPKAAPEPKLEPQPEPAPKAEEPPADPLALPSVEGVHYFERVTGGAAADAELPMIVAIHGLGDNPRDFAHLFDGFDQPARVIFPRALDAHEPGWSWFPIRARDPDVEALAAGIEKAADTLAPAIAALAKDRPTVGKPIVTGFSQGGMLTFTLAVHHGELFSAAFPVGGWFPPPLMDDADKTAPADAPPMVAFHGDQDRAVKYLPTAECVAALQEANYSVELKTYEGVGHAIPPAMRAELMAGITGALPSAPAN